MQTQHVFQTSVCTQVSGFAFEMKNQLNCYADILLYVCRLIESSVSATMECGHRVVQHSFKVDMLVICPQSIYLQLTADCGYHDLGTSNCHSQGHDNLYTNKQLGNY